MTFVFGTASRIWMDGIQAACAINEITQEAELDEAEVTTLCSTLKDYIPGLAEVTVEIEGLYDTNTAAPTTTLEYWMDARLGTTFPITFAPEGGADLGDSVYLLNGFLQEYSVENTVDEAASMEMTFRGTSGLSRAKVIHSDSVARTTTGNGGDTPPGTGNVDNTTSTAFGGVGVLQVSAASGTTPTLDVKIQHSSNGTVWADLITFTQQNAVNGEYATVAGTVNRYLRALWTLGGTTPSFNFNVAFKRNTA
jgi:hypothetical protein